VFEISASDLRWTAEHYDKPISYFFPKGFAIKKDDLSPLDEELLLLFFQLPETQKLIALEYTRQQVDITEKASDRQNIDNLFIPQE